MGADIQMQRSDWRFQYRVGALIHHKNKLLVQRTTGKEGYFLPGGTVSFGEFSTESLIRGFREETGIALNVRRLCFVVEHIFEEGVPCHRVELIYLAELKNVDQLPEGPFHPYDEKGRERAESEFCWIETCRLEKTKLFPACIRSHLKELPGQTVHLCENQMK